MPAKLAGLRFPVDRRRKIMRILQSYRLLASRMNVSYGSIVLAMARSCCGIDSLVSDGKVSQVTASATLVVASPNLGEIAPAGGRQHALDWIEMICPAANRIRRHEADLNNAPINPYIQSKSSKNPSRKECDDYKCRTPTDNFPYPTAR